MVQPTEKETVAGSKGEVGAAIKKTVSDQDKRVNGLVLGARPMIAAMLDVSSPLHPHKFEKIAGELGLESIINRMTIPELPEGTTPEMAQKLSSYAVLIVKLAAEKAGGSTVQRASHKLAEIFLIEGKAYVTCKGVPDSKRIAEIDEELKNDTIIPMEVEIVHLSAEDVEVIDQMSGQLANEFSAALQEAKNIESQRQERKEAPQAIGGVSRVSTESATIIELVAVHILFSNLQKNQAHMREILEKSREHAREHAKEEREEDDKHKIKDFKDVLREAVLNDLERIAVITEGHKADIERVADTSQSIRESAVDEKIDMSTEGRHLPGISK